MDQEYSLIILLTDLDGRLRGCNESAAVSYGYSSAELLQLTIYNLCPAATQGILAKQLQQLEQGPGYSFETQHQRKDGSCFDVTVQVQPIASADKRLLHYSVSELTARQRLAAQVGQQHQQLLQIDKMAALSTLVSGIAHEINNPVNLIQLNAQLLAEIWTNVMSFFDQCNHAAEIPLLGELSPQEARAAVPTLLDGIIQGGHEVQNVISDLKAFVRPNDSTLYGAFDINAAVRRALSLLSHVAKKKTARLQVDLHSPLPALQGDARGIEQVVVNLVLNALDALPDRSRGVKITTRWHQAADFIVLQVEDEGEGIAPEHLERVCEPFFTTKQDRGGTGLGLFVAYKLIRAQGGVLGFRSKPGCGTTVQVDLPIHRESSYAAGDTVLPPL